MAAPVSDLERKRRLGRRLGIAVFGIIVTAMTAHWTIQVLSQVWARPPEGVTLQCRAGLQGLVAAVRRARLRAASTVGDERAALAEFRGALMPEWRDRTALNKACVGDTPLLEALREVDALRYAEEHAVRYEALGLAPQRLRVQALEQRLFPGDVSFSR
jgi:hypothetical protein